MFERVYQRLSFGGCHFSAALTYIGLGLMLCALQPEARTALAGCDGPEEGCAVGYKCCGGECVPEDYVCCGDGSAGPGATCFCCSDCSESTCTNPSTLLCPTPEDCAEEE